MPAIVPTKEKKKKIYLILLLPIFASLCYEDSENGVINKNSGRGDMRLDLVWMPYPSSTACPSKVPELPSE
jgi:hypothetical protein